MPETSSTRAAVALVIGVGDYLHADRVAPLRYAARDAKDLARLLRDADVGGFASDRVAILTQKRARRDRVVHHLSNWLPAQARGADLALIYFAGHGMVQAVGRREEGFLLPYDADPKDVVTRGISMSDVGRWMDAIDAAAVVLCLDCCHAGKVILRDPESSSFRDLELRPAVLQGIAGKGRFLIASCDEGQKSLEAEELGHGLFTYHLLRGLAGAGDRDGDGKVGVAELFTYVSAAVDQDAREKFGLQQRPWTSATWAGDVYLSRPKKPGAWRPKPASRPTSPDADEPRDDVRRILEAMAGAEAPQLIRLLRRLRDLADPAAAPAIFRCLGHPSSEVRQQAKRALHGIGWERVSAAVEGLAREGQTEFLPAILEGLEAFEAHPEVVRLLDRLVALLRGDHRNRALLLLERKRLGVELDKVETLFRELHSPYRIEKALGQGLLTVAYLARLEAADLRVVVQVLRPESAQQPQVRVEFLDLAHQAMHFKHQNLVLTREVQAFPERHVYYAVRDYVDGVTLQKLLESKREFQPGQIVKVIRQLLSALTPLHERSARHGGIKPSNIFLCQADRVILGDPSLPAHNLGVAGQRLAYDYRYAPPEMFRSGGELGPASDLYALGCVAYELASGQPPFASDNYLELAALHGCEPIPPLAARGSRLGKAGDDFILRLLAATPADRFGSVEEALATLERLDRTGDMRATGALLPLVRDQSLANYRAGQSVVSLNPSTGEVLGLSSGALGPPVPSHASSPATEWFSPPSSGAAAHLSSAPGSAADSLAAPPLDVGDKMGRYEILGILGRGGMGCIYKARDPALERLVALKLVPSAARQRFAQEVHAVARLDHPNIVSIYDVGDHEGVPFYAMQLVEGGTLDQHLQRYVADPRLTAALVEKIARGVRYAHEKGVLHRDLKPSNILLNELGEPLISDFGLAKVEAAPKPMDTAEGTILGTPAYMSPEQVSDSTQVSRASDLWSLGVILYQLLTGQLPFAGTPIEILVQIVSGKDPPPPRSLRVDVDPALEAICLRCLEKDPRRRYPSAAALAEELARWLRGEPPAVTAPARPVGIWQRLWQYFRRRKS